MGNVDTTCVGLSRLISLVTFFVFISIFSLLVCCLAFLAAVCYGPKFPTVTKL